MASPTRDDTCVVPAPPVSRPLDDRRRTVLAHGVAVAALCGVNVWVAWPLFKLKYLWHTSSIEYAFISIAQRMRAAWPHFTWWPEWYGGIPFQNSYPPLLHFCVATFAAASGLSTARSYHVVVGLAYCLVPLSLFVLARVLTASLTQSFLAACFASVISPSAWLMPGYSLYPAYHQFGQRFVDTTYWGEGPHTTSVALLPLALAALHLGVTRVRWTLPAAAAVAAVVLTNWLGGFALAIAAIAYLWSIGFTLRAWSRALLIGVIAYGLAGPMIPPSTLMAVRHNAQIIGGHFRFSALNGLELLGVLAVAAVASRLSALPVRRFAIGYAVAMTAITLLGNWCGLPVVPQPERYHTEMEIGLCLLLAVMLPPQRWVLALALIGLLYPATRCAVVARAVARPVDIRQTSEFRVARWFDSHMLGCRVSAPGSISFSMNIWTETPQIEGGFDQGITNYLLHDVKYQLMSGDGSGDREAEVAIDWLKALGVHAVAVSGVGSTEAFKPIRNPLKFKGKAVLLWQNGGDSIYRVPQRSSSLARAIPAAVVVLQTPQYANMTASLHPYLAACDDPLMPDVSWRWLGRDRAVAAGVLKPDQVLSIQMAYHPGWSVKSNGIDCETRKDGLGQLLVLPNVTGLCVVELRYDGGVEMRVMKAIFWLSLLSAAMLSLWPRRASHASGLVVRRVTPVSS